jgi:hypothetical protein
MKNYRLKPEAVPFFKDGMGTKILPWDVWQEYNVDDNALEEVEECYVSFGFDHDRSSSLCGWGCQDGGRFAFTIHFPSMKHREYDKFKKGAVTRELMNKIQKELNYFYASFDNGEE